MMRRFLPLLALIALPAHAGTKATYLRPDGGSTIIEVADNGDARIGPSDDAEYGLLVKGRFYMVEKAQGRTTVTRMEDIAAAAGLSLPPGFNEQLKSAKSSPSALTNLEPDGSATVAGRVGKRYKMKGSGGTSDRLVVSDDPALKPVGAAMEGIATASVASMAGLFGKGMGEDLLPHIRDMFSRGTPLQTFDGWVLTKVEKADVSQGRVQLPAKPLSVQEATRQMREAHKGQRNR
jgi:hypothetical protein